MFFHHQAVPREPIFSQRGWGTVRCYGVWIEQDSLISWGPKRAVTYLYKNTRIWVTQQDLSRQMHGEGMRSGCCQGPTQIPKWVLNQGGPPSPSPYTELFSLSFSCLKRELRFQRDFWSYWPSRHPLFAIQIEIRLFSFLSCFFF